MVPLESLFRNFLLMIMLTLNLTMDTLTMLTLITDLLTLTTVEAFMKYWNVQGKNLKMLKIPESMLKRQRAIFHFTCAFLPDYSIVT